MPACQCAGCGPGLHRFQHFQHPSTTRCCSSHRAPAQPAAAARTCVAAARPPAVEAVMQYRGACGPPACSPPACSLQRAAQPLLMTAGCSPGCQTTSESCGSGCGQVVARSYLAAGARPGGASGPAGAGSSSSSSRLHHAALAASPASPAPALPLLPTRSPAQRPRAGMRWMRALGPRRCSCRPRRRRHPHPSCWWPACAG